MEAANGEGEEQGRAATAGLRPAPVLGQSGGAERDAEQRARRATSVASQTKRPASFTAAMPI